MMTSVDVLRALHVSAAVLLLGNVTVTGFWATFLYRVRDTVPFRQVARAILWADFFFTAVGGALLAVTGILLLRARHLPFMETSWVVRGASALGLALLLWLVFLLRDQFKLMRMPKDDRRGLRTIFLRWTIVGWITTFILFYGLWVMVAKS
jgi:uncharacterized membrane protein